MKTAYVISGQLTPRGTLELDECPPLLPGPVWVSVQPAAGLEDPFSSTLGEPMDERRARMEAAIGCVSDGDARRILEAIESEFEKVDTNEWC